MDFIFGSLLVKPDVATIAPLLAAYCILANIPKRILGSLVVSNMAQSAPAKYCCQLEISAI
jgi:hypothetical protein